MMGRAVVAALLLAGLFTLPGCLWLTGTVTAVLVNSGSGSHHGVPAEPPLPDPVTRAGGPYYLLDGQPVAVAMGDFLGGGVDGPTEVAVIFENGQRVDFYEGDGEGRLWRHSSVPLRSRNTVALEVVPPESGKLVGLLVATSQALELVRWQEGRFVTSSLPFAGKPDLARDLVVLHHDRDGILDVAVSSHANNSVEFFRLSPDRHRLEQSFTKPLILTNPPLGLTTADFHHDPKSQTDLAVLAEEGGRTILLLHLARPDGTWCEKADDKVVFSEPVLSLAHGGDFDVDHDPKSTPDVVASRSDGTLAVLVYDQDTVEECGSQMAGRFLDVQAGARHFSPRPAGVLAVHLPGGLLGTWDRVTVDEQLNAVVCSYFPSGGDDPGTKAERTVTYPLPGKGRAVSVGDLNGDSIGDLVAVSADAVTPVLTVLLARSLAPIQSVKDEKKLDPDFQWPPADPFYYPSAIAAGEPSARRQPPRLGRLAHGWGGSEGVDPFLAAVDRDNEEVAIFFLNPSLPDREERYPRLGERPIGIVAGQFDAKTGDDVLVGAQDALHLLHNLGPASQPRFEVESIPFAEIQAADPAVKDLDFGQDIELQNPSGGYFDANEFLDVAIPFVSSLAGNSLTTPCGPVVTDEDGEVMLDPDGFPVREPAQVPVDYVIVILNPGAPERRKVRFYRVPDGPNKLEPANLNRDPAVDLIVACGDKVAGTNVVYLLFGDEQHPGTFLEGEPLPPISLCSPPGISKGVAAAASNNGSLRPTPSLTADQWPPVDWILSSVGDTVQVYRRKDWLRQEVENKERWLPVFQVPMEIAHGDDPEGIFVHDFFPDNKGPDGKGLLDVAVIFESEETGVLFFKNNGSASGSLWEEAGPILPVGAPQDLAVIRSAPDLTIAVAARTKQRVEFFQWIGCDQECSFSNIASIPLARANEPGYFTGFASSLQPDGGLALAFRLEDGDLEVGSFPVDLGFFPPRGGATREQLLKIGEADPPLFTRRVWVKAPPGDNQITAALCLGAFSGQESPLDLLAYFPDRFTVCYRGLMDPQNSATIGPNGTAFPPLEGPLVDWREVQPGLLAIATKTAVALHQINSHLPWREPEWSSAEASVDPILRIATGWTSRQKALRTDLFVARLESARVQVETLSGASLELVAGGEEEFGALAAADLNGDGRDDLAVVDSRLQRLHVFLQSGSEGSLAFTQKSVVDYLRFVEPVDLIPLEANGDGRRDLALAARTGEVFLFLGNGAGFFTEPQVQYAGPELEGIRAHDLDGDGRDEILAAVGHPGLVILAGR